MVMKPQVFTLLDANFALGEQIAMAMEGTHHNLKEGVADKLASAFKSGHPVIAIMASGIIIRSLAPHLTTKHDDAPVISVSPDGQHIVPLLGGHHGANTMAKSIAACTGGKAIISTASDHQFDVSLDEPPAGLTLANPHDFKPFVVALLNGEKIKPDNMPDWLKTSNLPFDPAGTLQITLSEKKQCSSKTNLVYHPQNLIVGIGCERGTTTAEISELMMLCLEQAGLAVEAVACITTIDLKADEQGLNETADNMQLPLRFFSAEQLNEEADRLATPSQIVMAEVGCPGVAEGAALAAAGATGKLLIAKTKSKRATCAIAIASQPVTNLPGRARGKLSVVGIGPGSDEWRSPQASSALSGASDWVGYGLYLDLVADLNTGQKQHRFKLGKEEARVRHAFELAGQGLDVALVCSGDAAIYAMAALAYEVLDKGDLPPEQSRVDLQILPGISAFQAASARAGALIGHDFCTISLSDLLTPWSAIEQRLQAAAKGDFNVAFYNPRSLKRTDQLKTAIKILTPFRKPDTPVIIASNLGRPSEKVKTVPLCEFKPQEVDMLTIVLVGSSQSTAIQRGDGKTYCYTPRGYANKPTKAKQLT